MIAALSRRRIIILLAVASVSLTFAIRHLAASSPPAVYEQEMRAELARDGVTIIVPINQPGEPLAGKLALSLLNESGAEVAGTSTDIILKSGRNCPSLRLAWPQFSKASGWEDRFNMILWTRVRYSFKPDTGTHAGQEMTGVRALGLMVKELFALRTLAPSEFATGSIMHVRAFAEHPLTGAPVSGVRVTATLYSDEVDESDRSRRSITKSGETHADGSLSLDFDMSFLPMRESGNDIEYTLKFTGARGTLTVESERDISFRRYTSSIITTDKGLYQPGQTLHVRLLAYDSNTRRPRQSESFKITITDGAYKTVFERHVMTDRFGVAATDWAIPETVPLGEYGIEVRDSEDDWTGGSRVRVSRYELPTFITEVEPDRAFYLSGQDARVKVTARFVYGEPVKSGRASIARETSREWNFKDQRWEVEEEGVWEGDADDEGAFTATIPLAAEHDKLGKKDRRKYDDLEYVARYTEAASGRSEERRFCLRVTREPIHVYAFSPDSRQTPGLPLRFYVVANYADGSPATADISVEAAPADTEDANDQRQSARPTVFEARTDEHGIALIETTYLWREPNDLNLKIAARDEKGAGGNVEENLPVSEGDAIRLKTARALYHRGEPLKVAVESTVASIPRLQVELLAEGRIIRTQTIAVRNNQASVEFAPGEDLAGRVTISAYDPDEEEEDDYVWSQSRYAARTVLFPKPRTLELTAQFDSDSVKPGEAARATFASIAPDGRTRETSLGVVIYDAAVEERERTESESGQGSNRFGAYYSQFFNWHASISDVTLAQLEQLDYSKPFPASLELIADALLQREGIYYNYSSHSARVSGLAAHSKFRKTLAPFAATLEYILNRQSSSDYPQTEAQLNSTFALHGVRLDETLDPWSNPYRAKFGINRDKYEINISSDGPDERPGTRDDFNLLEHSRPFFEPAYIKEVERTFDAFKLNRGHYPRKADELLAELRARSSWLPSARDPWGTHYEIRIEPSSYRAYYEISIVSAGPNRIFDRQGRRDDVTVARFERDWFADMRESIRRALDARYAATRRFPTNEAGLRTALKESGIDFSSLRDPWDQPLVVTFREVARFGDRAKIERVAATPQSPAVDKTLVEPVTRTFMQIRIGVYGGDRETGYSFSIASYEQVIKEESGEDAAADKKPASPASSRRQESLPTGLAGAIQGIVTDAQGAIVPSTTVTLTDASTGAVRIATTDEEGFYTFTNLTPGIYSLRAYAEGFKAAIIQSIAVRLSATTSVDVTLEVGTVTEMVMISAGDESLMNTSSAQVSETRNAFSFPRGASLPNAASTPRLRQDFPETLLWQPSLITGADGRAELRFKVADSITTWRMAVFGSTEEGLIGSTVADLRAFQPFFVEHQPPPSLTIGDEIETPVVARNYQERAADVTLKLAPATWMQLLDSSKQSLRAPANGSATAHIRFKAVSAGEFKQEASAIGADEGDRIAKPVSVRFDGRDTWRTYADLFQRETTFDINIPQDAIPGSSRVELKLYPNLFAHALEGIQGIVQRPYGCMEQTTSAGYANLIVLQYLKQTGRALPDVERKAQRNLVEAIARMRSFASGGGYSYFDGSGPDIAVTSYALRFLAEAREFAPVDESILAATRRFLVREQRADGEWQPPVLYGREPARVDAPRLTALVVRALAASMPRAKESSARSASADNSQAALMRGLDYLAKATREYDDPYALALFAIAAREAGRVEEVDEAARKLASLGQTESGALFWDVKANTPFYGWGRAGRMETTGLVVKALSGAIAQASSATTDNDVERAARLGLLFLVQSKDQYGVWYSTQATVNVLQALIAMAPPEDVERRDALNIEVGFDDGKATSIEIPADAGGPMHFDLSEMLPELANSPGDHRLSLRTDSRALLSASIVARESVPWREKDSAGVSEDGGLRLRVSFDKTEAKQGDMVNCTVHAERVGSWRYGMMLAEIGLPPGVDVDIERLRRAPVSQFDVTPDRVVLYLWPQAGGTRFSFAFHPRLKINAMVQPSLLYDYYNPDARVSLAPARFVVR